MYGYTKETCPKRKYENHRLILSGVVLVLIAIIVYIA